MKKILTITISLLALFACNKKDINSLKDDVSDLQKLLNDTTQNASGANEVEYVDLGLSVKWATCNIGANKPEEYGEYYAWGEVATKSTYDWSTYKYCNGSAESLTKYCTNSSDGTADYVETLAKFVDDIAYITLGGNWRMPTVAEWAELRANCTWTWITVNGVNGYMVTSTNSNSIFLPAAGYRYGSELRNACSHGYYWSSSLCSSDNSNAWRVDFKSTNVSGSYTALRCYGRSVRPVLDE